MMSHTPGPWILEVLGNTLRVVAGVQIPDERGEDVALIGDPRAEQTRADAAFIASAPDQYAALCELSAAIREHHKRDSDATYVRLVLALTAADAAVAKAEGRKA